MELATSFSPLSLQKARQSLEQAHSATPVRRILFCLAEIVRYPRPRMVDIHCHILYGLDDGPASLEMALEMAEISVSEGVTHIVATPHANDQYPFVPELIQLRRDEIQARMGDRLVLATGCDFHLSFENLQDIRQQPQKYSLNQKNYLLVEFADFAIPPSMDQTLHQLQLAGLHPIITHPERNPLIRAQADRLLRWLQRGCYAQVTAASFLGRFGPAAKLAAETWMKQDAVHFVASDAHNTTSRPPRLREAFEIVAKQKGEDVAQALFIDNPRAAFDGKPLPYFPESAAPNEPEMDTQPRRRKRFWFF
jgi:protein-tyrosine phosphatase